MAVNQNSLGLNANNPLLGTSGGTGVSNNGKTITLGANFTTSGANNLTLTTTGVTNVTLPTTGTLVDTGVTTLSSLSAIGTIGVGVWQGTAVGITYGGTGQTTATAAFGALSPLTTKGDLLSFSTANARLPVGTDGYVLTADSGQLTGLSWSVVQAYKTIQNSGTGLTQRTIANFTGAGITASDDAGNSRTNITLATNLQSLAGVAITNGNLIVSDGTSIISKSSSLAKALYVSKNGDDTTGTGSYAFPYLTIQKAINSATSGAFSILVYPGTYTENLTINNITNLDIQGVASASNSANVVISGHISITGTTTRPRLTNLNIQGFTAGTPTIYENNTQGRLNLSNCSISHSDPSTPSLRVSGGSNFVNADYTFIGDVVFDGAPAATRLVTLTNSTIGNSNIGHANYTVAFIKCPVIGTVTHSAGIVTLSVVGIVVKTGTDSIISTANLGSGSLVIQTSGMLQADFSMGLINKTGTCPYLIGDTNRSVTSDTLTGTNLGFIRPAVDIDANYTPTNYTPTSSSVTGNLAGIDAAIATAGGSAYKTVQNNATPLTQRTVVNFAGTGLVAADDAGNTRTNVTLASGISGWNLYNTNGILTQTASNTYTGRTLTGTANRITVTNGDGVSGNPTFDISSSYVGQSTITTLGTVASGTWNSTVIGSTYGGTGVNNGSNTITLAGNLVTSGANSLTLTTTGATNVTLPTTGTLVNSAVTSLSSLATVGTVTSGTWSSNLQGYTETNTAASATGTVNIDMSLGNNFTFTLTGNTTFTISNVPLTANRVVSLTIKIIQGAGAYTVTWPASFAWSGGVTPTVTTINGRKDVFTAVTTDAGTQFLAFIAGQNFA